MLSSDSSSAKVQLGDQKEVVIENSTANGAAAGSKVFVSIKPQALTINSTDSNNGLQSKVTSRSYLGASTEYVVKANLGVDLRISSVTGHGAAYDIGQDVVIDVDWKTCTILSNESAGEKKGD